MKRIFILILCSFLGNSYSFSQLLPPYQPEQNPCNALQICGSFYTPYSYQGIGTSSDLVNTPCGLPGFPCGEDNVVWFKLNVTSSGIMVFKIVPTLSTDDYDWALLNGTGKNCNEIGYTDVIRCNFNTNAPVTFGGQTGLNMTSTTTSVPGGTTGSNFCKYVEVTAGETYYLMVNNFGIGGSPTSGFNLDFVGSTATFNLPPAPKFQSIVSNPCNITNSVRIKLDQLVKCSSIATNGSDFTLSPSVPILSAVGVDCGSSASGYTDEIIITFSSVLSPGTYTLNAATGTDGNTLLNLCDVPLTLPDALSFTVYKLADTVNLELCAGQLPYSWNGISLTGSGWGTPYITGNVIGCDSITRVFVEIVDTVKTYDNLTICTNQLPYTWNGIVVTAAGSPAASKYFLSTNGCDSMSYLNLTVTPPKQVIYPLTLCSYELPYNWNGTIIPEGALSNPNYDTFHTITSTGCDSFTILNLTVHYIDPINLITDTHACGSFTYKGNTYTNNAVITDTFFATSGCDSAYVTFNIFVHYNTPTIEYLDLKGCDSVEFRGVMYYQDTFVIDSFKSQFGCDSFVVVNNILVQNFDIDLLSNVTKIVDGEIVELETKGNSPYEMISWWPNEYFPNQKLLSQYFFPHESNKYIVTAKSNYGCIDTAEVFVEVVPLVPDMLMPNAFSPNGDGLNDDFKPIFFHETGYRINYFHIFDRWGNLVFTLENSYVKGWNGINETTGKKADVGVYYYIIEVQFVNGQVVQKKGDVTLLK